MAARLYPACTLANCAYARNLVFYPSLKKRRRSQHVQTLCPFSGPWIYPEHFLDPSVRQMHAGRIGGCEQSLAELRYPRALQGSLVEDTRFGQGFRKKPNKPTCSRVTAGGQRGGGY